jgi:hypothetical protein
VRVSHTLPRLALLALSVAVLAGCGTDAPTVEAGPPSPSAVPTATASAGPAPTSTLPPGVDALFSFRYENGRVIGPQGRIKVAKGQVVRLVVTSDKADEVHLHGYDEHVDVRAGGTVSLTVRATIPGVFECELEDLKVVLTRLQVS